MHGFPDFFQLITDKDCYFHIVCEFESRAADSCTNLLTSRLNRGGERFQEVKTCHWVVGEPENDHKAISFIKL